MTPPKMNRRHFLTVAAIAGAARGGANRVLGADDRSWSDHVEAAGRLIAARAGTGEVAAAVLLVRRGRFEFHRAYGAARPDTPFLIASPTKPMTVSAAIWLRDQRQLALSDPVRKYLPAFAGADREAVTIRHLLTHTSGLPDMLPENVELRQQHAPLSEFVARTCRTPLLFRPGEKVGYQSMGILLAATILEKIAGQPMPAFLAKNIFQPLGMSATSLGLGGRRIDETARCQVPDAERSNWDWNSAYWRNLGAPWGGAHATARDLAAFLEAFVATESPVWPASTRREMREIQTGTLRPSYGYGFVREPGAFGKTCSADTFGHFGSTGTVFWHDPATATTCVVLTTKPAVESRARVLMPVSESVGRA